MQGTQGWVCPKCSTVYAPWESKCSKCSPAYMGLGSISGWPGTITLGGPSYKFTSGTITFGSSGTVYAAPPKSDAQKLAEAKADADDWRDKFERLLEAVREVIEEHQDEDDND